MSWYRYRFHANEDDYRPVAWPPPGPYWCTGYGDGYSTVVAYLPPDEPLTFWWPEATNVDAEEVDEIVFSDRFPEPEWWADVKAQMVADGMIREEQ